MSELYLVRACRGVVEVVTGRAGQRLFRADRSKGVNGDVVAKIEVGDVMCSFWDFGNDLQYYFSGRCPIRDRMRFTTAAEAEAVAESVRRAPTRLR